VLHNAFKPQDGNTLHGLRRPPALRPAGGISPIPCAITSLTASAADRGRRTAKSRQKGAARGNPGAGAKPAARIIVDRTVPDGPTRVKNVGCLAGECRDPATWFFPNSPTTFQTRLAKPRALCWRAPSPAWSVRGRSDDLLFRDSLRPRDARAPQVRATPPLVDVNCMAWRVPSTYKIHVTPAPCETRSQFL
jgi:hypothetical protein